MKSRTNLFHRFLLRWVIRPEGTPVKSPKGGPRQRGGLPRNWPRGGHPRKPRSAPGEGVPGGLHCAGMRAAWVFGVAGPVLLLPALGGAASLLAVVASVSLLLAAAGRHPQGAAPTPRAVLGVAGALAVTLGGAFLLAARPVAGFLWVLCCCYLAAAAWFLGLFARASRWSR